jgi:Zn-dependent peptidase ImmA (M78 family)
MRRSLLRDLRRLMPQRPLGFGEALRIAELQANRLLQWRGILEPPVPASLVAKFPRVQVETIYPLGVSGATAWSDGRWQVILNAGEPAVRQKFSAVHELKHVIDHPFAAAAYPDSLGVSSAERQEQVADYFAACVLMPRRWVKRAWGNGTQDVKQLARMFGVSREAMRYRLTALGLTEQRKRCEVAA